MSRLLASVFCSGRHVLSSFLLSPPKYHKKDFSTSFCFKVVSTFSTVSAAEGRILQGKSDIHNALVINSAENSCLDVTEFRLILKESIKAWHDEGLKAVWFKVALPQIEWLPILREEGFKIHRSHENNIFLYLWLSKGPCRIPLYPHHMVGVGGLVINDQNQILVVQEMYRNFSIWKLPGGYVDSGEDISQAAIREVHEETRIKTEFDSLLGFRFSPKSIFECSDIYFVVRLLPLTTTITKQVDEVLDCKWMNVDEFLTHKEVYSVLRKLVKQALQNEKYGIKMKCSSELHPITKIPQLIYSITNDPKK